MSERIKAALRFFNMPYDSVFGFLNKVENFLDFIAHWNLLRNFGYSIL